MAVGRTVDVSCTKLVGLACEDWWPLFEVMNPLLSLGVYVGIAQLQETLDFEAC